MQMKKGWMVMTAMACFVLGMTYSIRVEERQKQSTVQASTVLNEQIQQYEKSLKEEEEENTFIPYSETTQVNQSTTKTVNATEIKTTNPQPTTKTQVNGVSHNNISKLGQEGADVLKTVVREVLRTVVKFFDQLISD